MIEQLRIRDLGVIAEAVLDLGPGFTAITGETGAGKTMVVTALGLLMGARSDAGAVRAGAEAARVGGLVRTDDVRVAELVEAAGGEIESGDLMLTRTVNSEGRSRASVGGSPAPAATLAKIADQLFVVHGQSEQLRLRSAAAQRETLDRFGGDALFRVLADYQQAYARRRACERELAELREQQADRGREAAGLREQLEAIAAVDPQPGEVAELTQRIERLSNIEMLRTATAAALRAIASEAHDAVTVDSVSLVGDAFRELDRVRAVDARLAALAEQLDSVGLQLGEIGRELSSYVSELDHDAPDELEQANERLAQLNRLMRDYRLDIEALLARAASVAARLTELDGDDDRIEQLTDACSQLEVHERTLAEQLSTLRRAAAVRLGELVTIELHALALPDARFQVEVAPAPSGSFGADTVQLLLQPHAGAAARPLAKGASGGELSRVMLALEVVVSANGPVPTFVFDEVDAGVGGAAAIEIGRRLAILARHAQVIVVTHLAQVAAFANNHLQVVKDAGGGFTRSSCRRLEGKHRLAEMARLLSGLSDSTSALAHAAELLELGADS